jgi:hypothetical protein
VDGDSSQFIDVVGTDSQAAPIIHESGTPPHPDSQPHPDDGGSQCLDVSDGEGQGMDDSVIVIPGSPRRGGGGRERDRDVSIIDISDSSKVPVPRYIRICYDHCCGSGAFLTPGSGIRNRLFPDLKPIVLRA